MISTISAKGWVVIPAELRRKYHLTPGTKVEIVDNHGVLTIIPITVDLIEKGEVNGAVKRTSLSSDLVEERDSKLLRE
jgi:AbrB family looped-hinge helix DNA binding protein